MGKYLLERQLQILDALKLPIELIYHKMVYVLAILLKYDNGMGGMNLYDRKK